MTLEKLNKITEKQYGFTVVDISIFGQQAGVKIATHVYYNSHGVITGMGAGSVPTS